MNKKQIQEQIQTAERLLEWAVKNQQHYKAERFKETIDYLKKKLKKENDKQ